MKRQDLYLEIMVDEHNPVLEVLKSAHRVDLNDVHIDGNKITLMLTAREYKRVEEREEPFYGEGLA